MNLTTTQAAKRLNIDRHHLTTLIASDKLPATRFGRAWVIDEADLARVPRVKRGWPIGKPRKPLSTVD